MKSLLQYCICNSHANKASKACCCCCCCCLYNRLRLCPHQRVFIGMRFRCHRKRTDRLASTQYLRLSTLKFKTERIESCDVSWTPGACYKHTRLRYFLSSFPFWCVFDRPHKNDMCAFSFKSRLSRALSNRCVFDKNAQRFSEDGRPKRIEMYAKTQNVNEM